MASALRENVWPGLSTNGAPGALSPQSMTNPKWDPESTTVEDLTKMAGPMQEAKTWTPDENSLVANQLTNLLKTDSPWVQRARTSAAQFSNSRGTLNSSMAAGAGEAAAIDSSLPIAQADAAAWLRSQSENTQAQNLFSRDSNQFRRTGALDIAGAGFRATEGGKQRTWQSGENTLDRSSRESIANMEISARASENALDRSARSDLLDRELGARAAEDERARQAQIARDAVLQNYRLDEINATTDARLREIDAANGTNLARDYRVETTNLYEQYASEISRINASDMDADVKAAQIAETQSLFSSRQAHLNTVFSNQSAWNSDWAQFSLDFGTETKTTGPSGRQP